MYNDNQWKESFKYEVKGTQFSSDWNKFLIFHFLIYTHYCYLSIAWGTAIFPLLTLITCKFCSENVKFSLDELSEIKRISNGHLCLLGFKPLDLLKDYHNLKPSTFVFPTDEVSIFCSIISNDKQIYPAYASSF